MTADSRAQRIAEITKRCEEASTAPWKAACDEAVEWEIASTGRGNDGKRWYVTTDHVPASQLFGDAKEDAAFIAAARTDVPWLLAELAKADARIKELESRKND